MIQDIEPKIFHNEFKNKIANENSNIIYFKKGTALVRVEENNNKNSEFYFPKLKDLKINSEKLTFLFEIDNEDYFLCDDENIEQACLNDFEYKQMTFFRNAKPLYRAFAGVTAFHLYGWYRDNKFCGRCGNELVKDTDERMVKCEKCGNMIYPKIAPAVIVGLIDGDRLLMTKYAVGYKKYALIAGFNEIGEGIEKTVEREVMEEVGLKVKNITYYKSQPWGFSSSLLMGFYCELDGDSKINLDRNELSEGTWFNREDIIPDDNEISLTREMIYRFKILGKTACIK